MIPSILALIQGVGEQGCHNITQNVAIYDNQSATFIYKNETSLEKFPLQPIFSVSVYFIIIGVCLSISLMAFIWTNRVIYLTKQKNKKFNEDVTLNDINLGETINDKVDKVPKTSRTITIVEKIVLFSLNFIITFLLYGVQTGLQSYAALPYGENTFHLSINLSI